MSMSTRATAALAAGYFLGRFKKLRLALVVGSVLANKNVRDKGLELLKGGTEKLSGVTDSPQGKQLTGLGAKLLDAGKAAAVTVVAGGVDKLSDSLRERGSALRAQSDQGQSDD